MAKKEVLCCLGERRRPVTYSAEDEKSEIDSLTEAVKAVFQDVISPSSRVFFQLKNENWAGEFVDIKETDSVPHHAVIRAVVEKPSPQVKKELLCNLCILCTYLSNYLCHRILTTDIFVITLRPYHISSHVLHL